MSEVDEEESDQGGTHLELGRDENREEDCIPRKRSLNRLQT